MNTINYRFHHYSQLAWHHGNFCHKATVLMRRLKHLITHFQWVTDAKLKEDLTNRYEYFCLSLNKRPQGPTAWPYNRAEKEKKYTKICNAMDVFGLDKNHIKRLYEEYFEKSIVAVTQNVLGIFNDPFEFAGDYGNVSNETRSNVFDLLISHQAPLRHASETDINRYLLDNDITFQQDDLLETRKEMCLAHAFKKDQAHGPTFGEFITEAMKASLLQKAEALGKIGEAQNILAFVDRHANTRPFALFRNNPPALLSLDKSLRDAAAAKGEPFNLPIIQSMGQLTDSPQPLIDQLFTSEVLELTKKDEAISKTYASLSSPYALSNYLPDADDNDLALFKTQFGQLTYFWMYQQFNCHLVSAAGLLDATNALKEEFSQELGSSKARANELRHQLDAIDADVLFTQEADQATVEALTSDYQEDGFHRIDQNPNGHDQWKGDGTYVFLRSRAWAVKKVYSADEIKSSYPLHEERLGRINAVVAQHLKTGKCFFLASAHSKDGKSAADSLNQIKAIQDLYQRAVSDAPDSGMQLLIGMDANTKKRQEVAAFRARLNELNLVATNQGATTVKQRMVTTQDGKACQKVSDEEDFLILNSSGDLESKLEFTQVQVGLEREKEEGETLPNITHRSDHYGVKALIDIVPISTG